MGQSRDRSQHQLVMPWVGRGCWECPGRKARVRGRRPLPSSSFISAQDHLPQGRLHPITHLKSPPGPGFTHRGYSAPGTKAAASWWQGAWAGKPWHSLAPTESGAPAPGHTDRQVLRRLGSWGGRGSRATDTQGGSSQNLCACVPPAGWGPTATEGRGVRGGGEVVVFPGGACGPATGRGGGRLPPSDGRISRPPPGQDAGWGRVSRGAPTAVRGPGEKGRVLNGHTGAIHFPHRRRRVGRRTGNGGRFGGLSDVQEPAGVLARPLLRAWGYRVLRLSARPS